MKKALNNRFLHLNLITKDKMALHILFIYVYLFIVFLNLAFDLDDFFNFPPITD